MFELETKAVWLIETIWQLYTNVDTFLRRKKNIEHFRLMRILYIIIIIIIIIIILYYQQECILTTPADTVTVAIQGLYLQ